MIRCKRVVKQCRCVWSYGHGFRAVRPIHSNTMSRRQGVTPWPELRFGHALIGPYSEISLPAKFRRRNRTIQQSLEFVARRRNMCGFALSDSIGDAGVQHGFHDFLSGDAVMGSIFTYLKEDLSTEDQIVTTEIMRKILIEKPEVLPNFIDSVMLSLVNDGEIGQANAFLGRAGRLIQELSGLGDAGQESGGTSSPTIVRVGIQQDDATKVVGDWALRLATRMLDSPPIDKCVVEHVGALLNQSSKFGGNIVIDDWRPFGRRLKDHRFWGGRWENGAEVAYHLFRLIYEQKKIVPRWLEAPLFEIFCRTDESQRQNEVWSAILKTSVGPPSIETINWRMTLLLRMGKVQEALILGGAVIGRYKEHVDSLPKRWQSRIKDLRPNNLTYVLAVGLMTQAGKFNHVDALLREMKAVDLSLRGPEFSIVCSTLAKKEDAGVLAEELLCRVVDIFNYVPSVREVFTLLKLYARRANVEKAEEIFSEIRAANFLEQGRERSHSLRSMMRPVSANEEISTSFRRVEVSCYREMSYMYSERRMLDRWVKLMQTWMRDFQNVSATVSIQDRQRSAKGSQHLKAAKRWRTWESSAISSILDSLFHDLSKKGGVDKMDQLLFSMTDAGMSVTPRLFMNVVSCASVALNREFASDTKKANLRFLVQGWHDRLIHSRQPKLSEANKASLLSLYLDLGDMEEAARIARTIDAPEEALPSSVLLPLLRLRRVSLTSASREHGPVSLDPGGQRGEYDLDAKTEYRKVQQLLRLAAAPHLRDNLAFLDEALYTSAQVGDEKIRLELAGAAKSALQHHFLSNGTTEDFKWLRLVASTTRVLLETHADEEALELIRTFLEAHGNPSDDGGSHQEDSYLFIKSHKLKCLWQQLVSEGKGNNDGADLRNDERLFVERLPNLIEMIVQEEQGMDCEGLCRNVLLGFVQQLDGESVERVAPSCLALVNKASTSYPADSNWTLDTLRSVTHRQIIARASNSNNNPTDDVTRAEISLRLLRVNKLPLDVHTYNNMARLYLRAGQIEKANNIFERMRDGGLSLNATSFALLMECRTMEGNYEAAQSAFEHFLSKVGQSTSEMTPEQVSGIGLRYPSEQAKPKENLNHGIQLLMDHYLQKGNIEELEKVSTQYRRALGTMPLSFYRKLFSGYARSANHDKLQALLDELCSLWMASEAEVEPEGQIGDAAASIGSRSELGWQQDYAEKAEIKKALCQGFGALVNMLCKEEDGEAAEEAILSMNKLNVKPTAAILTPLMALYGRQGEPDLAGGLIKWMEDQGMADTAAYNSYIASVANNSGPQMALRAFTVLKDRFEPNPSTFTTVIGLYAKMAAELSRSTSACKSSENWGLDALEHRKGSGRERSANDHPQTTCDMLREAEKIFEHMKDHGLGPTTATYGALMGVCTNVRAYDRALALHDQMKASGVARDDRIYSSLICMCTKAQTQHIRSKAWHFFHEAVQANVPLSQLAINDLVAYTCRSMEPQARLKHLAVLLDYMESRNKRGTSQTYHTLLKEAAKGRDLSLYHDVTRAIERQGMSIAYRKVVR